ncbi:hypothetical protein HDU98_003374 [Podochytrium sp. JEL0797]|nr:hypothetical protein HDU98_003374 [Podochytrium sp. JEL0797]
MAAAFHSRHTRKPHSTPFLAHPESHTTTPLSTTAPKPTAPQQPRLDPASANRSSPHQPAPHSAPLTHGSGGPTDSKKSKKQKQKQQNPPAAAVSAPAAIVAAKSVPTDPIVPVKRVPKSTQFVVVVAESSPDTGPAVATKPASAKTKAAKQKPAKQKNVAATSPVVVAVVEATSPSVAQAPKMDAPATSGSAPMVVKRVRKAPSAVSSNHPITPPFAEQPTHASVGSLPQKAAASPVVVVSQLDSVDEKPPTYPSHPQKMGSRKQRGEGTGQPHSDDPQRDSIDAHSTLVNRTTTTAAGPPPQREPQREPQHHQPTLPRSETLHLRMQTVTSMIDRLQRHHAQLTQQMHGPDSRDSWTGGEIELLQEMMRVSDEVKCLQFSRIMMLEAILEATKQEAGGGFGY